MYFPDNITLDYFLLNTYPGYFICAIPISLLSVCVYLLFSKEKNISMQQLVFRSFFIAYLSGLIQLTLMFDIVRAFYSGILVRNRFFSSWYFFQFLEDHPFFSGEYCIKPQFYISSEKIGNLIMYMPFSILLCLAYNNVTFIKTIASGMSLVVTIELLQPIFGRQGDVTDIIINSIGIITSAVTFFVLNAVLDKWLIQKK